jgi:D-alanyl-D-alanine carboxypeptidase
MDAAVAEWFGDSTVGGVVAVVRLPDGVEPVAAVGNGAGQRPLSGDEVFRLGSITKAFTAVLILQFVERGDIRLDEPLAEILPEFGVAPEVTIRHLLQHTSGLTDYNDASLLDDILLNLERRWRPEELLARVDLSTPTFAPGTQWAYSNTGYILLGLVLERISGHTLESLAAERILNPAGLVSTAYSPGPGDTEAVVTGYIDLDADGVEDSLAGVPYEAVATSAWSAGAMIGTAADLVRFMTALFGGELISEASLATMIAEPWPVYGYALGIEEITYTGGTAWGHSGGIPGYASVTAHDPRSGITVAALTNCATCPSDDATLADIGDLVRALLKVASGE